MAFKPEQGGHAGSCRGLVGRLLAYNAELDLARRLDVYLADPDNYRAFSRHLLHLAGTGSIHGDPRGETTTMASSQ